MTALQHWCRVTIVDRDGSALTTYVLEGWGTPDLGTVDDVARLALSALRVGGSIALTDVSPVMRELLELAGLPVEMEG